jgi:hypothetical protein
VGGSDGFLLIGKNNGTGGSRTQRIGYNTNFDLTIGDYGGGTGPWVEAVKISYASPTNVLVIVNNGNVSTSYNFHDSGNIGSAESLLDFNPYGRFDRYGQIRFGRGQWQAGSYTQIKFDTSGSVNDVTTYIRHDTNGYSRFDTYIISGGQQFPSDIRIKKNIQDINDDTVLQLLLRIEPKSYDYIDIDKGTENV